MNQTRIRSKRVGRRLKPAPVWAAALAAAVLLSFGAGARGQGAEPPVAELRERAEQELSDYYGASWQETDPAKRRGLAHQMLRDARRADSATERYVLLRKAREFAESAGDAALALAALRELEQQWDLPSEQVDRASLIRNALSAARKPEAYKSVVRSGLGVVNRLISRGAYREANALVESLRSGAVRARDRDLIDRVSGKQQQTRQLLGAYRRVEADMQTLEENPEDPSANMAVGRFYAFQLGQWEQGLGHLAKGDAEDNELVPVARADLAEPDAAEAQKQLGDRYWTLAEQRTGPDAQALRSRARHWYRQALDRLSGSTRELALMRAASAESIRWAGRVFEPGLAVTYRRGETVKRSVADRLSFDWRSSPPSPKMSLDDRFSVTLEGYLKAPREGRYLIVLRSMAGPVDIRVNDHLVLDGPGGRVSVWLYEGLNAIELEHRIHARPDRRLFNVQWSLPDDSGESTIGPGELYHVLGEAR